MTTAPHRPKLFTPIVVGVMSAVIILGLILCILQPSKSWAWIASMSFLPIVSILLTLMHRRLSVEAVGSQIGKLRAGIVGAGVLLATALGFSITDMLQWTHSDANGAMRMVWILFPAMIIAGSDLLGSWLSHKAEGPPEN